MYKLMQNLLFFKIVLIVVFFKLTISFDTGRFFCEKLTRNNSPRHGTSCSITGERKIRILHENVFFERHPY